MTRRPTTISVGGRLRRRHRLGGAGTRGRPARRRRRARPRRPPPDAAGLGVAGDRGRSRDKGYAVQLAEVPDAEAAKTSSVAAVLWSLARRRRLHPDRRRRRGRRRHRDRPRGLRRSVVAARRSRRPGADDAARHGRRGRRRQDRHQHRPRARTSSAPSIRRPACSATSTCSRRCQRPTSWPGSPRSSSAGFIADPVILDLVEAAVTADSRPRRSAATRTCASSSSAPSGSRPTSSPPTCGELAARDPQLRPHVRARDRAGRALHVAARRGDQRRHGLRRRARPADRSPRPARRAMRSWRGTGRSSSRSASRRRMPRAAGTTC